MLFDIIILGEAFTRKSGLAQKVGTWIKDDVLTSVWEV